MCQLTADILKLALKIRNRKLSLKTRNRNGPVLDLHLNPFRTGSRTVPCKHSWGLIASRGTKLTLFSVGHPLSVLSSSQLKNRMKQPQMGFIRDSNENVEKINKRCFANCVTLLLAGRHEADSSEPRRGWKLWLQDVYFHRVHSSFDNDSHCDCLGNQEKLYQVYRRVQGSR